MKFFRPAYVVLALLLLISLSACISLAQDVTPPPGYQPPVFEDTPDFSETFPLVSPNPETGASLYIESCAPCHGDTGLGDGPTAGQLPAAPPAIGSFEVASQSSPQDWFQAVTLGNLDALMPPFAEAMSEGQRWDVLAYTYSLGVTEETIVQGETVYAQNCAACHGDGGQGDGPEAANLAVPPTDFTDQALMAQFSGEALFTGITEGVNPVMPGFTGLSEDDRWAVVAYLRSLTFSTLADDVDLQVQAPTEVAEQPAQEPVEEEEQAAEAVTEEGLPASVGVVRGQVSHGSTVELPDDLTVELVAFDQSGQIDEQSIPVEADGSFEFSELDLGHDLVYFVTTDHQDMTYSSTFGVFPPGETEIELPVTIYDTTTDASDLVVSRLHIFFEFPSEEVIQIVQLYVISNPTDKTVIPASIEEPAVRFSIPENASNLQFQEGSFADRFVVTEDGFGDTLAILPGAGDYQLLFSYDLPNERSVELAQPVNLNVDALIGFVIEGQASIKSEDLQPSASQDLGGVLYQTYVGGGVQAGDEITIEITKRGLGLSGIDFGLSSLIIGGLALAVALGGAYWMLTRGQSSQELAPVASSPNSAESLMDAIIALDDRYEAGELDEAQYQADRQALKDQLREMMD
ncbi:MAG: hypothetical protein DWQ07_23870 [Chloroflexi bacterium]|nr:MAG: hypothetical protein DWQ07_23870 [Chloroflexota bacterium]MBL1194186.1 hypothetical protein [Chloroflexota bacterium]NOH11478.1 c-type cytochrome [Chloroflexota bacterium]